MNSAIFASFVDPCQVGRSHELYSAVPPHASMGFLHLAMARYTCKGIFPIILVRRLMLFDWTTRFPTKIDNKAACECGCSAEGRFWQCAPKTPRRSCLPRSPDYGA